MATFETMPAAIEQMQVTLNNLSKEIQELRLLHPINELPIDSKELLKRLAISEPTLIRMRKRKEIPYLEVCGHYRYVWQDVIKFLGESNKKNRK